MLGLVHHDTTMFFPNGDSDNKCDSIQKVVINQCYATLYLNIHSHEQQRNDGTNLE